MRKINLMAHERNALARLLLLVTSPDCLAGLGLNMNGPEFRVAMDLIEEIQSIGKFDPDNDSWVAERTAG